VIASERLEMLSLIYKLSSLEILLNTQFLNHFHNIFLSETNKDYTPLVKKRFHDYEGSKLKAGKDYVIAHLKRPHRVVIKILSRLYGESNHEHCKV